MWDILNKECTDIVFWPINNVCIILLQVTLITDSPARQTSKPTANSRYV